MATSRLGMEEALALEQLEACLHTAFAARLADEARRVVSVRVRSTFSAMARGAAVHHELAWQIVAWCCEVGGAPLRDALRAKLDELRSPVTSELASVLVRHGQLDAAQIRALYAEVRQYVCERAQWTVSRIEARAA